MPETDAPVVVTVTLAAAATLPAPNDTDALPSPLEIVPPAAGVTLASGGVGAVGSWSLWRSSWSRRLRWSADRAAAECLQPAGPAAAWPRAAYPQAVWPQAVWPQAAWPQAAWPQA